MKILYCDGSSSGKSGKPGGWAYLALEDDKVIAKEFGGRASTTNNVMELFAMLAGVNFMVNELHENEFTIVSDSQYALGIANGTYIPKKNLDLARALRKACSSCKIKYEWVKGHSGNKFNEQVDILAKLGKKAVGG